MDAESLLEIADLFQPALETAAVAELVLLLFEFLGRGALCSAARRGRQDHSRARHARQELSSIAAEVIHGQEYSHGGDGASMNDGAGVRRNRARSQRNYLVTLLSPAGVTR